MSLQSEKVILFDGVDLSGNTSKMNPKLRRLIQTFCVVLLVSYTTLLAYQSLSRGNVNNKAALSQKLSLSENDYSENNDLIEESKHQVAILLTNRTELTSEIPSATATVKPPSTTIYDVFISVKTTKHYHKSRLPIILKTWFQLAKAQTWFFTDADDPEFQLKTNGHMINTNCSSSHNRKALCCKMSVEFDTFIDSDKKWFCHFDDDNYVNVPRLVRFLGDYSPREDWYLGKTSIQAPLEITNREKSPQKVKFWFATGGAGFCLSRALALKMMPVASGGKFISIGEKIRLPDDVTMGYIIEHLLKKPLTVVDQFHSHLEPMKFIRRDILEDQISFSYSRLKRSGMSLRLTALIPNMILIDFCHCIVTSSHDLTSVRAEIKTYRQYFYYPSRKNNKDVLHFFTALMLARKFKL